MAEPTMPICETCPYWAAVKGHVTGPCLYHAPAPVMCREGDPVNYPCWPIMTYDDGCGRHPDFPAYIDALKAHRETDDGTAA